MSGYWAFFSSLLRVPGPRRLPLGLHGGRGRPEPPDPGIQVGDGPALEAHRVELARQLRGELGGRRLHQGPREQLVGALGEFCDGLDRLERPLVGALEAVQALGDFLQLGPRTTGSWPLVLTR